MTDRPSPFTLDPGEERSERAAGCNEESGALLINLCVCVCVHLVVSSALSTSPITWAYAWACLYTSSMIITSRQRVNVSIWMIRNVQGILLMKQYEKYKDKFISDPLFAPGTVAVKKALSCSFKIQEAQHCELCNSQNNQLSIVSVTEMKTRISEPCQKMKKMSLCIYSQECFSAVLCS